MENIEVIDCDETGIVIHGNIDAEIENYSCEGTPIALIATGNFDIKGRRWRHRPDKKRGED